MAGYTRQSTYTDGDVINAADSNDEFDQVLAAFNNSTGHKHDGTAAEGPVIGLIGDPGQTTPKNKIVVDNPNDQIEVSIDVSGTSTEQFVFKDGVIEPTTNNDIDLGFVEQAVQRPVHRRCCKCGQHCDADHNRHGHPRSRQYVV